MRKRREMTCAEFSARMAQLVASGEDIFSHPHVKRCKMHRALLEDLETIARAAKQLFPDVDPGEVLWQRIEEGIAAMDGFPERVSSPFPGFRLITRVRVGGRKTPAEAPPGYDRDMGSRLMPGTRLRAGGPRTPPCHGEGR